MFRDKLFEPTGVVIAAATLIFSLILFYNDTNIFLGSLFAAVLASALTWATYVILRLVLLTFRS